jgi:hypothetical protein
MDNICIFYPPKSYLKRGLGHTNGPISRAYGPIEHIAVLFSFLCSLADSFSLGAVLLISLDKNHHTEVESERHISPNALHMALHKRVGRPRVSFASSLTCID